MVDIQKKTKKKKTFAIDPKPTDQYEMFSKLLEEHFRNEQERKQFQGNNTVTLYNKVLFVNYILNMS